MVHLVEVVQVDGGVFADVVDLGVPQVRVEQGGGSSRKTRAGRHAWVHGEFLRGPIPLAWLSRVCELPGQKVLAVALAVWWVSGLRGRKDGLKLTSATLRRFGVVDRTAKYRALKALEGAGLIRVRWEARKNPVVTILDAA